MNIDWNWIQEKHVVSYIYTFNNEEEDPRTIIKEHMKR